MDIVMEITIIRDSLWLDSPVSCEKSFTG
jgi:hypothetical protein